MIQKLLISLMAMILLVSCSSSGGSNGGSDEITSDLIFIPDSGLRMDNASNPGAKVNDDGSVSLLYEDRSATPHVNRVSTSSDGITFAQGEQVESPAYFRSLLLPDGTHRTYGQDATRGGNAGAYQ